MRLFTILVSAAVMLSAGPADAKDLVVSQNKKQFEPKRLNATVGDKVVFVNDDIYAHNLYSETHGFEFNVRKQMPGDRHAIKLDKVGTFLIRCVIHPRMKLTVKVE